MANALLPLGKVPLRNGRPLNLSAIGSFTDQLEPTRFPRLYPQRSFNDKIKFKEFVYFSPLVLRHRQKLAIALYSDEPSPVHQDSADFKRSESYEQWDSLSAKFAGGANLPFLLLQLPQIILNARNLMAGNNSALFAVPWLGMFTGLLGNLSLLSYFIKKRETEAVVVQSLGVVSTYVVITQLAMAEAMPLPQFVATSVVIACGLVVNFMNYFNLLKPEIWHFWEDFITIGGLSVLPQVMWSTFVPFIPNSFLPGVIAFVTAVAAVLMARMGKLSEVGVNFCFFFLPNSSDFFSFLSHAHIHTKLAHVMMTSATATAAAAAATRMISLGSSLCHTCHPEGVSCSMNGVTNSWSKQPFEIQRVSDNSGISLRCENSLFGAMQFHCLSGVQESRPSRVSIAADYPDSVPDSSNLVGDNGYHPLEELKNCRRVRNARLTTAEMARTTVEANNTALLIFPGEVHCEPHEQDSWAEYQYVVDEYGEIFFEIKDSENILQDREASNLVNALIAMDIPQYENRRIGASEYSILETDLADDIALVSQYIEFEVEDYERSDVPVDWGMPDGQNWVHPIYFSKCLSKACYLDYDKMMDHPSNGVSVWGQLRPAFIDEEIYLRRLFNDEDIDSYISDWKDEDILSFRRCGRSTIYRLDIVKIELFSVYGVQSIISLQDFQEAEPDILVHSSAGIIERLDEEKVRCNVALRALCRKKGLHVEGASLIGVDSLGIDVRVFCGSEVRTYRFPFKARATSEVAAEKQIKQLLFPRAQRKRFRMHERPRYIDGF